MAEIEGQELAQAIGGYADEKQAEDIVILDLRGKSTITDFFVLCTGTSLPHLKAIKNEINAKLAEDHGVKTRTPDGVAESQWLVMDYGDVIVHIFHAEKRDVYALEDLWSDAPRIGFSDAA